MRPLRWTTLGQCRLVAGEAWDLPANMVRRAPSHWLRPPREILCVLLALDGPPLAREPLEGAAAAALADEFFGGRGSITARLQRAVEAANRLLYQENRRAFAASRRYGGVVCLLLRGDGGYLAQVGPPGAYLLRAGTAQSYAPQDAEALLGQKEGVPICLSYVPLAAEARILLTDHQWEGPALAEALTAPDVEALWKSVVALAPTADSSAWLIGVASGASDTRERVRGFPTRTGRMRSAARPVGHMRPLSRVARRLWRWICQTVREVAEGVLPRPLPAPAERRTPEEAGTRLSDLLQPYLPLAALGIPLLALLLTGLLYWQTLVEGGATSAAYLRQAQTALSLAAQPDTNQDAARVYLQSALAQTDEALALRPSAREAQELRRQVQGRLDALNRVTRLTFIHVLYEYLPQGQPGRVLQAQGAIYVLDQHGNRVYRHRLDESGQALAEDGTAVLLQQGQEVGEKRVGALVDMVWLPADSSGRLLTLDQQGTLWAYAPGSAVQALALPQLDIRSGTGWRMSSYGGRLYVLAPQQGQVLRYPSLGDAFGPPETYFPPGRVVDCVGVRDMAIDGYVYLLWESGVIRRFLGGMDQSPPIFLPDAALSRTPALFAHPQEETGHLYVADTARQRVVELTKEGELVRQLQAQDPSLLMDLHGLCVDEAQGRLLVTDGHRLLLAELPPLAISQ